RNRNLDAQLRRRGRRHRRRDPRHAEDDSRPAGTREARCPLRQWREPPPRPVRRRPDQGQPPAGRRLAPGCGRAREDDRCPRGGRGITTEPEHELLQEEVRALAAERGAVILAHNYQVPEVQDVADYVGYSLGLSREAAATDADAIVFCGVHFMAETAAILSPD